NTTPRPLPHSLKSLQLRPSHVIDVLFGNSSVMVWVSGVSQSSLNAYLPPAETTFIGKSTRMPHRIRSISWVPFFSASPVPQFQNQCQLQCIRVTLHGLRGAGPCHCSRSRCDCTDTTCPFPVVCRLFAYHPLAKFPLPNTPSCCACIPSAITVKDRRCVSS